MRIRAEFRHMVAFIRGGPLGRPFLGPGLVLTVVGLALTGCNWWGSPPQPGLSAPTFVGVIQATCGPADGPALQMDLTPEGGGSVEKVSISLWQDGIPDAPIVQIFTMSGGGAGSWCPMGGECIQASQGTVWFDEVDGGPSLGGRFRLEMASGDRLEGAFRVRENHPSPLLCG